MADAAPCACEADEGRRQAIVFARDVLDGWNHRTPLVVRPNLLAGALAVLADVVDPDSAPAALAASGGDGMASPVAEALLERTGTLFSGLTDPDLAMVTGVVLELAQELARA